MAPIQKLTQQNNQRRQLRSSTIIKNDIKKNVEQKRKAESSPPKDKDLKRSAFGDITNAIAKSSNAVPDTKKIVNNGTLKPNPKPRIPLRTTAAALERRNNAANVTQPVKKAQVVVKRLPTLKKPELLTIPKKDDKKKTESPEKNKAEESKAKVEQMKKTDESRRKQNFVSTGTPEIIVEEKTVVKSEEPVVPPGVDDFDKENLHDPSQVALYSMDIFNYLKEREELFKVADYIDAQPSVTMWMRSLLVDWMVEVQECFELNHETLYLGVKLVDLYLSKEQISKEKLQLVGAAGLFVASKFDERCPPMVKDFLYICDGAYTHKELINMEASLVKAVDFDLGMPLSYRFLRRYARCAKLTLPMLTLARYILEMSLMEYSFIQVSESRIAAAALLLALKMKMGTGWTKTLEYYSGYTVEDIKGLTHELNAMLHRKPKEALATIRNKYSHRLFFEVATLPLVDVLSL
ncbi:hypothetical protein L9F63_015985 [Diploptera punctata]|uniref:G2/mitotic-specific cyclin-B3 n=1 Tax=Diploptera punctata TaxID=6984 RepID=A0AAD8A1W6_DIPPU|nr:hypothetical protein L9F63_015985 [Diploptera punctata]